MSVEKQTTQRIQGYCALCVSRCGSIGVIENGRLVALEPDPSHPTGKALCAKGRAAPELVYHPDRLLYPLKRTRPKGDPDPGWQRISWEEALELTAANLKKIAAEHGPESVVFSVSSPSTSASDDYTAWITRLMNVYGSPNLCAAMELCGWGRYQATTYTFGAPVPGAYMPDLDQAGCILFWGYNPNLARLTHATATVEAVKRGARLIVVDPRRTGIAKKADVWLQVRPGTDAALALGIAGVMIERGWYDQDFVRDWTNGPLLVCTDTGRLLTQADLSIGGSAKQYLAWNAMTNRPVLYDPGLAAMKAAHRNWLCSAHSPFRRFRGKSSANRRSISPLNFANSIHPSESKQSAGLNVTRLLRLPKCSGKRAQLRIMPGAGWRCRPTPPRSPGQLPNSRC